MHVKPLLALVLCSIAASEKGCIKWGNTFDVSLESKNVRRECTLPDNRPICCSAVNNENITLDSKGIGSSYYPKQRTSNSLRNVRSKDAKVSCVIHKQYVSSALELHELAIAKEIEKIEPNNKHDYMIEARNTALLKYVTSEAYMTNSTLWLDRVKKHMSSAEPPIETQYDREFLSKFKYTRTCGEEVDHWVEYIEPIGITARHPFGFSKCRTAYSYYNVQDSSIRDTNSNSMIHKMPKIGRSDVDYVLLQSGAALYNQTHTASGKRIHGNTPIIMVNGEGSNGNVIASVSADTTGTSSSSSNNIMSNKKRNAIPPKHYMLDAGTSTFDSSLFWFTCGYSQVK